VEPSRGPPIVVTLPSSPEDLLALSGDVSTLVMYSYVDHITTMLFASAATGELEHQAAAGLLPPAPLSDGGASAVAAAGVTLQYAPILAQPGVAAVVMAATWIVAGYVTEAFAYKNTINCTPDRNLLTTVQGWLLSAVLITWIAVGSDVICGCDIRNIVGGLTGADGGYIFGSLTVLIVWRFLYHFISNMLWL